MKSLKLTCAIVVAGVVGAIALTPTNAQKSAAEPGNYWNVQDIIIEPGHTEQYLDFVKDRVMKECNYGISKGYYVGCKILSNVNKRMHEPDVFIVRMFKDIPSVAEQQRRNDEFNAMQKLDDHSADTDGASRTPIRKLGDNYLLQELNFGK